jgi:hypothetical protein
MASLARLTCEMYLPLAPGEGKPRERYERLLALHRAREQDLPTPGLHDAHAWLPPIAKKIGSPAHSIGLGP